MRKSSRVTLTVVAVVGLASCGRKRPDPCQPATFNEMACQDAIRSGGYRYNGVWVPMAYHNPYPYYYDSYRGYVSRGGTVRSSPDASYAHTTGAPSGSGVERGGFGSTGGAQAAGE
jgi:hypothetical protein